MIASDSSFRFNNFEIPLDAYNEAENLLLYDITMCLPLLVLEALLLFGNPISFKNWKSNAAAPSEQSSLSSKLKHD
ncbi:hypothetical protein V6N13_019874 [Hibiscus sabdariffa]|uniref:Uncharacterized protein n=1 Tax=Hibiscus sabdariffa TaxID=183260 RepID=A0ABR2ERQ9_9ROSI